jgi:hypothetical protein
LKKWREERLQEGGEVGGGRIIKARLLVQEVVMKVDND